MAFRKESYAEEQAELEKLRVDLHNEYVERYKIHGPANPYKLGSADELILIAFCKRLEKILQDKFKESRTKYNKYLRKYSEDVEDLASAEEKADQDKIDQLISAIKKSVYLNEWNANKWGDKNISLSELSEAGQEFLNDRDQLIQLAYYTFHNSRSKQQKDNEAERVFGLIDFLINNYVKDSKNEKKPVHVAKQIFLVFSPKVKALTAKVKNKVIAVSDRLKVKNKIGAVKDRIKDGIKKLKR